MVLKMINKKIDINAFIQVSKCESESPDIKSTTVVATLYSKARATTVAGDKFTGKYSEKKKHCSQFSNGNKNSFERESLHKIMKKDYHILTLKILKTNTNIQI